MFDLSPLKLLALLGFAVIVFGPDRLPKMIVGALRTIRRIRELSADATQEIKKELGPGFQEFDLHDLGLKELEKSFRLDERGVGPVRAVQSPEGISPASKPPGDPGHAQGGG